MTDQLNDWWKKQIRLYKKTMNINSIPYLKTALKREIFA